MNHSSKFAPKAQEGFLLGYGSNSHTYRVYNSNYGKVMETINVRFDETNGSQKEHLPHDLDEPPIDEVIRPWRLEKFVLSKQIHVELTGMMMVQCSHT